MTGSLRASVFSVAAVVLLSKVLGFAREMVIAHRFGTSSEYDLYLVAIILPALLYGVLNYACFYLFVPHLSKRLEHQSAAGDASWRGVWPTLNLTLLASLAISLVIIVLAPYVMRTWASGYLAEDFAQIVFYSRVTAIIVLLGTGEAFMRAFLNVRKIYTFPAAGYIVFNLFSILSIILLHERLGVGAVAVGLVGGLAVQNIYLAVRMMAFKPGRGFSASVATDDTRAFLSMAGILVLIELINRSYFMIDRYFAPQFGEGVISGLNYSQVLVQLPDAVIGFAIGTVVFPIFSRSGSDPGRDVFAATYRKAIATAIFFAVPLAAFFFVNAESIVYVIFQRGEFNARSVELTASLLRPYTPTIIALFLVSTSIRACYAGGWTKAVFVLTVMLFCVKFLGSALLPRWLGYPGLTAATSTAQVCFALTLLIYILIRTHMARKRGFLWLLTRILVAGSLALGVCYRFARIDLAGSTSPDHLDLLMDLVISAAVLGITYLILAYALGLRNFIDTRILRIRRPDGEA